MIVYSKKIIEFVREINRVVTHILLSEIRLKVGRSRFYNREQKLSYPINIVIYNNKPQLGYFDSNFYELGFHERLMHAPQKQLHDVIRHEIAHYMIFIEYGQTVQPHSPQFRSFCKSLGWGEEVYRSTTCPEEQVQENNVLRKVQKLMALATSSSTHEAEQAMIKSQQLLLKHNVDSTHLGEADDEQVFLKRIMGQKRENAKMRAIGRILESFFVNTVYHRAGDCTYLEILGSAVNVEIAEYVALVLDGELDNLWNQAKKSTRLRGQLAKNSFFLGLAKGYLGKIEALKKTFAQDTANALVVIEKKLVDAKAMAYRHLTSARRSASYCPASCALGEQMGRQLTINPAINKSPSDRSKAFLTKQSDQR